LCGYIGGTKKCLTEIHSISKLLEEQKHRGTDGYGVILLHEDGKIIYTKTMSKAKIIAYIEGVEDNPFILLHHRATSVGGTKLKLAHPLEVPDSNSATILMQNGTNKSPYLMVTTAESDSEALVMLADIMTPEDFSKYILQDVGVIVWVKEGTVYLFKDDSRPLNRHVESGLVSSEPLVEGEWESIDSGFFTVEYKNGELTGLKTFSTHEVTDVGSTAVCSFCKKRQLIPDGYTVCNACVVDGAIQKKEAGRNYNVNNYNVYDDAYSYYDYYDDEYPRWGSRVADHSDDGVSDEVEMYRILGSGTEVTGEVSYSKRFGVALEVGSEIYLIRKTASNFDDSIGFMVETITAPRAMAEEVDGTFVPSGYTNKIIDSTELWAYWDNTLSAYDLQNNVYYLEPTLLSNDDKDNLIYNAALKSYAIPNNYVWYE